MPPTLHSLFTHLLPTTSLASPPLKPHHPSLTPQIAALHLHPTLEALLHILNHDLPSAHFLVRHMQAAPAVEGMLLHGVLHRAEGDFDNARAWVRDVADACEGFVPKRRAEGERLAGDVFERVQGRDGGDLVAFVYGGNGGGGGLGEEVGALIDDVEVWRGKKAGGEKEEEGKRIEARIRREAERVREWCEAKFGGGEFRDATKAWVKNSEEINKISGDMVSGGKGHREF
ncbi:hypothetical protein ACN47E_007012 [Coniothyrium glycines]